ncbi:MAG: hypothetical protein ACD_46C00667G0003, partial [uncultured bacterium]
AGYIDAVSGGGGLITVPMLLSIGLSPHVVLGTNKFAGTLGVFQSARVFVKNKIIRPKAWLIAILFSAFGSLIGSFIVQQISGRSLHKFLPILMIVVIFYIYKTKFWSDNAGHYNIATNKSLCAAVGTGIGFYDGFFGPGTASLGIATVMSVFKLNLIEASGVIKLLNFSSNFSALITFIYFGNVNYYAGLTLGLTYMLGSYLGAHFAIRIGSKYLRPLVMLIASIICIKLIINQWM